MWDLIVSVPDYCLSFYFANGRRHFEIKIKTENYKTQFISQKHAYYI